MGDRSSYEVRLRSFEGERVNRVVYFDCRYEVENGVFTTDVVPFHRLCFGLELHTWTGRILGLIWGSEFAQYGLDLFEETIGTQLDGAGSQSWDVSENEAWTNIIGQSIVSIEVYWSWYANNVTDEQIKNPDNIPDGLKRHYPQDIVISFDPDTKVYIAASIYLAESDMLFPSADEITVIFDKTVAQKYRIGPFAANETNSEDE